MRRYDAGAGEGIVSLQAFTQLITIYGGAFLGSHFVVVYQHPNATKTWFSISSRNSCRSFSS